MDIILSCTLRLTHIRSAYKRMRYHSHRCFLLAGTVILASAQIAEAMPEAADPHAPVAPAKYRAILEDYKAFRPTEPRDWQEVNREVAPKTNTEPTQDAPR